ncbi:MAG: hypothetical protein JXR07_18605 [Reichenbachiella sp.]
MNPQDANPFFKHNISVLKGNQAKAVGKVKLLSFFRITIFIGYLVGLVFLSNLREFNLSLALTFVFVLIFGGIVKAHKKAKFKLNQFRYLIQINEEETQRLEGNLHDLPNGQSFFEPNHAYAPDLDIFGFNSLYQLLVRSRLKGTRKILSQWMLKGATKKDILDRQTAILELKEKTDWRQEITALGMTNQEKEQDTISLDDLEPWLKEHVEIIDRPIWAILEIIMPLIASATILGFWLGNWPYQLMFVPLLINLFILKTIFEPLKNMTTGFGGMIHLLDGYSQIISILEHTGFHSALLNQHAENLKQKGQLASKAIKQLSSIFYFLQNRINLIYMPLNTLFLLDMIILRRTLKWHQTNKRNLGPWLKSVHHIDALSDLASFEFANPSFTKPNIDDNPHTLLAKSLGHPLIKSQQRIPNDFNLMSKGHLGLITGSNMSGKSTFLRTIGVNIVLAQMGAVVCAKEFKLSLMQVFTSMRTQDNLEENVSSFYAELQRIKQLLDSLNKEEPTFYMLDEILKGTNSEDRHKGAISLIEQLTKQNCMGLISTHDIQLAELSKENMEISNYSFNSTIEGDEINFNYKLTDGPCASFNASKLMEKMGIINKS